MTQLIFSMVQFYDPCCSVSHEHLLNNSLLHGFVQFVFEFHTHVGVWVYICVIVFLLGLTSLYGYLSEVVYQG